ncbi:hypothetical protein [Wenxinia saemankumensis]|uniref:Lipoprotein n=1 Tax=Wenxinia saemankumensis TaxID=1447782 RepID=A0A1M6ALD9_9RHOB|nr:hypothetical protein [Wenxinia saemankumensis]SHI37324.1 hypothetical protein SAMN05444417_0501 [Wenxinia saemankumensis]
MKPMILALAAGLALAGCGRLSFLNPVGWFGAASEAAPTGPRRPLLPQGRAAIPDPRQPVAQVTGLALEPVPDGAILRAEGLAAGGGYYNAELRRRGAAGGVLVFDLVAAPPPAPVGGAAQRLSVAETLSATDLAGIRQVRVEGAANALVVAR